MSKAVPKWIVMPLVVFLMLLLCTGSALLAFERGQKAGYQRAALQSIQEVANLTLLEYHAGRKQGTVLRDAVDPEFRQVLEEKFEGRAVGMIKAMYARAADESSLLDAVKNGQRSWQSALHAATEEFANAVRYHTFVETLQTPVPCSMQAASAPSS